VAGSARRPSRGAKSRRGGAARGGGSRSGTGAGLGFALGLALGLGVAALVYLQYHLPSGLPVVSEVMPSRAEPGSAGSRGGARPRFEFYTVLPEMEVEVPEHELAPRASKESEPAAGPGDLYVLQVGSFRRLAEADRLKASLALIGLEADIESVPVNGGDTWHRVRLGPYRELDVLDATRRRLRENGMQALVLKIRT